jgi:hypothetical protein
MRWRNTGDDDIMGRVDAWALGKKGDRTQSRRWGGS